MYKMIVSGLGLAVLCALFAFARPNQATHTADEGGIVFHTGTWAEALALAKAQNKLIFVDVYATWCGPCNMLKRNTFSDATVGKVFNEKYINVALDGEKGEGIDAVRRFRVRAYPTLMFVNAEGKVVHKAVGYHRPNELLELSDALR